jgi:hypothetical protein
MEQLEYTENKNYSKGRLHGLCRFMWPSGTIMDNNYMYGKKHGPWRHIDAKGRFWAIGICIDDSNEGESIVHLEY